MSESRKDKKPEIGTKLSEDTLNQLSQQIRALKETKKDKNFERFVGDILTNIKFIATVIAENRSKTYYYTPIEDEKEVEDKVCLKFEELSLLLKEYEAKEKSSPFNIDVKAAWINILILAEQGLAKGKEQFLAEQTKEAVLRKSSKLKMKENINKSDYTDNEVFTVAYSLDSKLTFKDLEKNVFANCLDKYGYFNKRKIQNFINKLKDKQSDNTKLSEHQIRLLIKFISKADGPIDQRDKKHIFQKLADQLSGDGRAVIDCLAENENFWKYGAEINEKMAVSIDRSLSTLQSDEEQEATFYQSSTDKNINGPMIFTKQSSTIQDPEKVEIDKKYTLEIDSTSVKNPVKESPAARSLTTSVSTETGPSPGLFSKTHKEVQRPLEQELTTIKLKPGSDNN